MSLSTTYEFCFPFHSFLALLICSKRESSFFSYGECSIRIKSFGLGLDCSAASIIFGVFSSSYYQSFSFNMTEFAKSN